MVMSFYRVTPEELDRAIADPGWARERIADADLTGEPDGYLDKACGGIQFLLDAAEVPVDLRIDGEPIRDDGSLSGWSAAEVVFAAESLRATSFEELARHYDPVLMAKEDIYPSIWDEDGRALDYLRAHYTTLVRFFEVVAASGSAAIMSFS
jgi:hypothetical protein